MGSRLLKDRGASMTEDLVVSQLKGMGKPKRVKYMKDDNPLKGRPRKRTT